MTTRTVFFIIECVIYLATLVLFWLKLSNLETLILMTLAFVAFIGLYISSKSRDRK
ncbi:hypothetical protein [Duncaniella dubosii]|jgi:hypothetical protein|uniref:hypothetical protein n=1 Tax=Duncaniella dubosii TaxID=2518971 RepID=UPI00258A801F|nr:hypothetical protein [uncultured Duncaniella sp.]